MVASKPEACRGCLAYEWGVGFVPPAGPVDASLIVVGQGPGEQEAAFGVPFYDRAPAGWRMRRWLEKAGVDLRRVLFTNIVWCWLPASWRNGKVPVGNRLPTPDEIRHCTARHLTPLLGRTLGTQVFAVGQVAQQHLLGPNRAKARYLGTTHRVEIPLVEPDGTNETAVEDDDPRGPSPAGPNPAGVEPAGAV